MNLAPADTFESLADEIVALCANIHGAEYRLIDRIRRLEKLEPWNAEVPDCAHWLNLHCGMDLVTAREKVRIARSLDDLPHIDDAFRSGDLSYSKVRAITRIAEPSTEDELIELAMSTTAEHVARRVRARRQADHLAAPGVALNAWKHRYLDCHTAHEDCGRAQAAEGGCADRVTREQGRHMNCRTAHEDSVIIKGRLPGELGALLLQALERASEWLRAEDPEGIAGRLGTTVPDDAVPGREQAPVRRADALAVLAERFLAASPSADESLNTADRFLITVHASAEALPEQAGIDPDDPPVFEDGGVAPPETVRRLGCDAAVVRILESSEGEPLDVGRKTRVIPPALRRALKRRDGGCRFPGCTRTRFVDGHHIVHWADGGETRLDNLVSVCRFHHRLVHEGGYTIVKDGSAFRFFRGDGHEVSALPRKRPDCGHLGPETLPAERWPDTMRQGSASIPPATGPP